MQNKSLTFCSTSENKDFPFEDTMKPRAPQIVETFWNYVISKLFGMTVCVRFVNALDLNVEERFVGFVNCSKKADAVAIYTHIKFFLQKCGIYEVPIVAQGYDGAAVMFESENGVQSKIRKDHPSAFCIHCMAHKLNLVLVEACKVNRMVNSFFLTLETI